MAYMERGSLVEHRVTGQRGIVVSDFYTRLVLDDYDRELIRAGKEGGTAYTFVNVLWPGDAVQRAHKVSDLALVSEAEAK